MNFDKLRNPQIKLWAEENLGYAPRIALLGAPVLADVDRIVVSVNMKVGAYTIAAQPDIPRNITLTHTQGGAEADTLGTVTITGTDILGQVITEVLTPSAGTTVSGAKAFKTVTSVVGAGWVTGATADTITVGVGDKIGLPFIMTAAAQCPLVIFDTAFATPTVTYDIDEVCKNTVATSTYNGAKKLFALCLM